MRLLDLFCGAGGAARGYSDAGFEVVGVDVKPQPNYPFKFLQWEALHFLEWSKHQVSTFDVIHASPPCQKWSRITTTAENHSDLITPLRPLLKETRLPWVIENVPGSPLVDPIQLCGSSFGLGLRRHRLFESNILLSNLPCRHEWQKPRYKMYEHGKWYLSGTVPVYGLGGGKAKEHWNEAMDIDWMTHGEMKEAIPPAYTRFIGAQLRAHIESEALSVA